MPNPWDFFPAKINTRKRFEWEKEGAKWRREWFRNLLLLEKDLGKAPSRDGVEGRRITGHSGLEDN